MDRWTQHSRPRGARRRVPVLAVAAVVALLAAACGADETAGVATSEVTNDDQPTVIATTSVLGDVAEAVAGDAAQVTTVMPPGSDPHSFEPSAQQIAQMQEADLVVANGAGLEQQLTDALEEAEAAGVPVFFATEHVQTLTFEGHDEHSGEGEPDHGDEHASEKAEHGDDHGGESEHDHDHGSVDPHFWQDPTRMGDVARALGGELGELTGDAGAVEERAESYAQQLDEVDTEVQDMLAAVSDGQRKMVTNHGAFGYFADRYDFEIVGTVVPAETTGAEPSAQDLEELAATIEQEQVGAIFVENTAPDQLAQTLASEADIEVEVVQLYSDSLGEAGSDAATYVDLLRTNAERVSDALGT